jgi:hypothetical protein
LLRTPPLRVLHTQAATPAAAAAAAAAASAGDGLELVLVQDPSLEEVLAEGVARLRRRPTWKLWTWPAPPSETEALVAAGSAAAAVSSEGDEAPAARVGPAVAAPLQRTMPAQREFTDGEAFRAYILEHFVREDLRRFLPRDDPKLPERPAEEAFRKRMCVGRGAARRTMMRADVMCCGSRPSRRVEGWATHLARVLECRAGCGV